MTAKFSADREKKHPALLLLACLWGAGIIFFQGCAGDGSGGSSEEGPSNPPGGSVDFATQIQPIFNRNCSCHLTFSAPQGEVLQEGASYDSIVNIASTEKPGFMRIKPGDPDSSYLVIKIDDNVPDLANRRSGDRMPRGQPPLQRDDIDLIRAWVLEGAPRAASRDDREPPSFNGATIAVPAGSTSLDVFWEAATDNKTPAAEITYKAYVSTTSQGQNFLQPAGISPRGGSTLRIGSLESDTQYFIVVRAEDGSGNQDSNRIEVTARTAAIPLPPGGEVDFATQVQPIFDSRCSCHLSSSAPMGEVLSAGSSFDFLVNVPSTEKPALLRVKPNFPDESYLVVKIDDAVPGVENLRSGERMPFNLPPLSAAEVKTIRDWISQGAKRSAGPPSGDQEPPVFLGVESAQVLSPRAVALKWTQARDNVSRPESIGYLIYIATVSGGQSFAQPDFTAPPGSTGFEVDGLDPDTEYFFVVRAQDGAGNRDSNRFEVSARTPAVPQPPGGEVDFATQVQPIFDRRCSCHLSSSAPMGEVLTSGLSFDFLVNVPSAERPALLRVKPDFPDESYLVVKIDDAVPGVENLRSGERMPFGLPPLDAADVKTIRDWISQGAKRSAGPAPDDQEPPVFAGVKSAEAVGPRAVALSWLPASDNVSPPELIGYLVYIARVSGGQSFAQPDFTVLPGSTGFEVNGLDPDTEYFFVVRARDAAGNQDSNRVEARARTPAAPPPPTEVDFATQVLPIFRRNCTRCHGGFSSGQCPGTLGLCFDSYEAIQATAFNGREIIPFNSDASELVKRIRGESLPRMPFDGPPFLNEEEIAIVAAWIDAGAGPGAPPTENRAPVADPGGPYSGTVGEPVTFSGTASFDPDGDPLTFEWDFGDGASASGERPQHTYQGEGRFQVTLVVSDGQLLSAAASTEAQVNRPGLFPRNPTMERVCSQCHGVRIVLADGTRGEVTPPGQGLAFFPPGVFMDCNIRSAQAWSDTISRMRRTNGCPMTDADESEIGGFLAANYSGGDPRADTFSRVCSACHSPSIPLSVPRSPSQWSSTVDRMMNRYRAQVTVQEREDIIGYLSAVAQGVPPTELPEAEARVYMNLVCSSCHSPGRVLNESSGLPDSDFRSFKDALELTSSMMARGCGLRGTTDVIIARWLSTVQNRLPDILSIDRYEFQSDDGRLEVRAWSSAGGAATLTVIGDGDLSAVMENRGDGEYRLERRGLNVNPGRITVKSSLGGALRWHR